MVVRPVPASPVACPPSPHPPLTVSWRHSASLSAPDPSRRTTPGAAPHQGCTELKNEASRALAAAWSKPAPAPVLLLLLRGRPWWLLLWVLVLLGVVAGEGEAAAARSAALGQRST